MRAWLGRISVALVVLGASCAEPKRLPPVTYVPIERSSPPSDAPAGSGAAILEAGSGSDPPSARTPVGPGSAAAAPSPPLGERCFKKAGGGCCGDVAFLPDRRGKKPVCPKGTVLGTTCKGIGPSCDPK